MTMPSSQLLVPLQLESIGVLRALISSEIDNIQKWLRMNGTTARTLARRNREDFLEKLQIIRSDIERGVAEHVDQATADIRQRMDKRDGLQ